MIRGSSEVGLGSAISYTVIVRTDYADMGDWESLARRHHIRLPQHNTPLTTGRMERLLLLTGKSIGWYRDWSGFRSLKGFIEANPEWSARAFAGLLIENLDSYDIVELLHGGCRSQ